MGELFLEGPHPDGAEDVHDGVEDGEDQVGHCDAGEEHDGQWCVEQMDFRCILDGGCEIGGLFIIMAIQRISYRELFYKRFKGSEWLPRVVVVRERAVL